MAAGDQVFSPLNPGDRTGGPGPYVNIGYSGADQTASAFDAKHWTINHKVPGGMKAYDGNIENFDMFLHEVPRPLK